MVGPQLAIFSITAEVQKIEYCIIPGIPSERIFFPLYNDVHFQEINTWDIKARILKAILSLLLF